MTHKQHYPDYPYNRGVEHYSEHQLYYNTMENTPCEKKSLFTIYLISIIVIAVILLVTVGVTLFSFREKLLGETPCPKNTAIPTAIISLHQAAYNANNKKLRKLLQCGMNPNSETSGEPLIIAAVNSRNTETVNIVLQYGGNPNFTATSMTPLDVAVKHNLPNIVETLINHGANVNHQDESTHLTALMYAAALSTPDESYMKTALILLDQGANVNLKNSDGLTALDLTEHDPNMYRLLQSYGATGGNK